MPREHAAYLLSQNDTQGERSLVAGDAMLHFVGVRLGEEMMPDETTMLRFCYFLERNDLT